MSGQLVASDGAPVGNLSIDCRDFLAAGFRYRYVASRRRTAVDYIRLTARVDNWTDSANTEALFLPVHLVDAAVNSPPTLVHQSSQLVAQQFVPMLLNRDTLSARDDVTEVEDLLVSVVSPLDKESRGYFVHRRAPWKPVVSFWLRDVFAGSVAFRAPTVNVSRVHVVLTVSDGHFEVSDRLRLSISVRHAQPPGPKITHNSHLTVIRGGAVCLGTDVVNVTDAGRLERLEVRLLRGGPLHGKLTVVDRDVTESFRWKSVERCDVIYHHDVESVGNTDQLVLRVSNGRRSIRTRVVVDILPGTVTSPTLKMNDATEVRQHGYAQLTTLHVDTGSSDVLYTITSQPRAGQLLMMYRPMTRGHPVSRFTQLDLDNGHIWYRHFGRSSPLRDSFRFRLGVRTSLAADDERVHEIVVRPHARDNPPRLVTSSTARLIVRETDVQLIGRDSLRYRDVEKPGEDVIFVVTCRPFIVGSSLTLDAGHIAYHDDAAFRDKNSSVVPLRTFTQSMIDGEMVAYVPPMNDIGPQPLQVQFIYSVSDLHGNFDVDQTFDVTVLPVNNQVDHLIYQQSSLSHFDNTTALFHLSQLDL